MAAESQNSNPGLGAFIQNLSSNLAALREFSKLVTPFLDDQVAAYMKANHTALIPIRLLLSAIAPEPALQLSEAKEAELRQNFGAPVKIELKPDSKAGQITVIGEAGKRVQEAVAGFQIAAAHKTLLYRSCLISLISSAEWFLSQVLRSFFQIHPEAAGVKDKNLTLEDLQKMGSISEAEDYLIRLRVDEIMWGGFEDWIRFLKHTVKLSMGYLAADEKLLVEIFQRRNIMIHNNGVVNSTYLSKVEASLRENVRTGELLWVDPVYLNRAIDTIERNFVLIAAELWKKLSPTDNDRSGVLTKLTLDSLTFERYGVAEGASRFLMEDNQLSERDRLIGRVNYWQTLKWSHRFEEVRKDIEQVDFSAKEDLLQLARMVLLDQLEDAMVLVKSLFAAQKIDLTSLETWPIFKELRNTESFIEFVTAERAAGAEKVEISESIAESMLAESSGSTVN